jgi:hypothetical protein
MGIGHCATTRVALTAASPRLLVPLIPFITLTHDPHRKPNRILGDKLHSERDIGITAT